MSDPETVYRPAALAALEAFGIRPERLTFAKLSENVTYEVVAEPSPGERDGAAYVLRLHRPGYHDIEALRCERVWVRALAAAGAAVPPPVQAPSGEEYVQVAVEATGERRWAGLSRWIEGEVLADVVERARDPAVNARHFERLGAVMAAMHDQSEHWTPPPGFRRRHLDDAGLMGDAPFWGPFWDHAILSPAERRLLLETRDKIRAALRALGRGPAAYGMIHADLHPGNVLIRGEALAVIDFDDAAFGWRAYDLAVALVFHQGHPDVAAFGDALVRGYRGVRPLSDETLSLLPMFLMARDMAQLGWLHQRPEVPWPTGLAERKARLCERAAAFRPVA